MSYVSLSKVKVELDEKELYADQNKPDDSKQIKWKCSDMKWLEWEEVN